MIKTAIGGVRYDTGSSYQIGAYQHGKPGQLSYWKAALYSSASGKYFFLVGRGAMMSRFHRFGGADGIVPVSEQEAREWAEAYVEDWKLKFPQ